MHTICSIEEDPSYISQLDLCRIISRYLKLSRLEGEIIYDGTGPRDKSPYENVDYVQVVFAGAGTDADTLIEERIRVNSAPKRLTIVSSDRRVRRAAHRRKATVLKSEDFFGMVTKELAKKRPIKEPPMKREGISEKETQKWLDIFGIDK